jgi:hypothetical protein
VKSTHIARAPDRVAHTLLDSIVDNYKPALDELSLEIAELEQDRPCGRRRQGNAQQDSADQEGGAAPAADHRAAAGGAGAVCPGRVQADPAAHGALLPRRLRRLFQIGELAQGYTDSLTGILQVYLNMSSNQTGEVMKALLTLITIITTPMMMVGTWYGMNFFAKTCRRRRGWNWPAGGFQRAGAAGVEGGLPFAVSFGATVAGNPWGGAGAVQWAGGAEAIGVCCRGEARGMRAPEPEERGRGWWGD